jgi:predicted metalloendopeptidase
MIINIQNELKTILKQVDWMDMESRSKALEKVSEY